MNTGLKPAIPDPYSALVRQHFFQPAYAGDLPDGPGRVVRGSAGEIAHGAHVQLAARIDTGRILALRFRVFGCPHLIAALDIMCGQVEGEAVVKLRDFNASDMLATLDTPPEKTGRLLLVEDAIMSLVSTLDK